MSEIQRFAHIWKGDHAIVLNDPKGAYCYYTDLLKYKSQSKIALVASILLAAVCGLLSALLVYEKSSHGPVVVEQVTTRRAVK
mgnify:CR=1 FL=1